ncbi:flagellar biosynthetic protein FliR [Jannaschia ovalis]|uniref:Flagellar biosynthetic protein FliR n=1 Tax=Jannaschia ovalis TaxID=3038773 RepID=A0ABY8LJ73_9RHOB|nr:flagellar biosynthetic protein FliR [Jannaschia sp. GRR-S6-38]WGH80173.1 flagellar biosynthetic protein FliR [Jannaschia sp. GRR-S6-38]
MIAALLQIHDLVAPYLAQGFAVFLRVGALMLLLPGLGDRMIPVRVRLVAAFALTAAVAPSVAAPPALTAGVIAIETVTGVAFGAVLRFVAQALTMAGMMAAQYTSLAQLFGNVEPSSAIGNLLNLAGLCLLMAAGLPLMVIEMLLRSYDVVPMGGLPGGEDMARWGVARAGQAFALAVGLAAPFALAALVYNAAMGVINRAMPQLMVALVGAPAITGASGVLLFLSAPLILSIWKTAMLAALGDPVAAGLP